MKGKISLFLKENKKNILIILSAIVLWLGFTYNEATVSVAYDLLISIIELLQDDMEKAYQFRETIWTGTIIIK